jgi:uncharacterized protein YfaS (alpha-2-macroglobulin family)
MILETLSLLNDQAKASALARRVAQRLSTDQWMSTQETAYSLLAMCEYAGVKESNTGISFSYAVNKNAVAAMQSNKTICQLKYSEKEISSNSTITLSNTGKSNLFIKVMIEGVPQTGDQTAASNGIKMNVVYKNSKGQEIDPARLVQGTDFTAEVTLTNMNTKGRLKEMALNQIFPAGWEIHNTRMDENMTAQTAARYQDIRDDRVYSYYELATNNSKTFIVQLNATYLGRFYLPTLYTEAMYDNSINARLPGKWVEVIKNENETALR